MKKISRLLAALPSLALPLFLAVLLPILMTGTAAAQTLRITNGTSSNFSSGTFDYGGVYVGFTNGVLDSNNLTVVNTNTLLNILFPLSVGVSGASNSLVISNGGTVQNDVGTIGDNSTASNNWVLVTGTNSLWKNSGDLLVGHAGAGNSLTKAGAGTLILSAANTYSGTTTTAA